MNVCLIHYVFYPVTGGVESHLVELASGLFSRGHRVRMLTGDSIQRDTSRGYPVDRLDLLDPARLRHEKRRRGHNNQRPCYDLVEELATAFDRYFQRCHVDVVHAHNLHHYEPEYVLALRRLRERGMATVLTIHEVWDDPLCSQILDGSRWSAVVTVSQHMASRVTAMTTGLGQIRLIYLGIDTTVRFCPSVLPDPRLHAVAQEAGLILHPARMLPWKGVIVSVKAMDIVRRYFPKALLMITDTPNIIDGAGVVEEYRTETLQLVESLGLHDNVEMRTFDYFELPRAYTAASVVVYPTIGLEPFGLVPVEAMACGCPVIVSDSGGLPESVVDGVTGHIVTREDTEALSERILELLRDQPLAVRMGAAGRAHAVACFDRDRMIDELVAVYEEVR